MLSTYFWLVAMVCGMAVTFPAMLPSSAGNIRANIGRKTGKETFPGEKRAIDAGLDKFAGHGGVEGTPEGKANKVEGMLLSSQNYDEATIGEVGSIADESYRQQLREELTRNVALIRGPKKAVSFMNAVMRLDAAHAEMATEALEMLYKQFTYGDCMFLGEEMHLVCGWGEEGDQFGAAGVDGAGLGAGAGAGLGVGAGLGAGADHGAGLGSGAGAAAAGLVGGQVYDYDGLDDEQLLHMLGNSLEGGDIGIDKRGKVNGGDGESQLRNFQPWSVSSQGLPPVWRYRLNKLWKPKMVADGNDAAEVGQPEEMIPY